jgi:hypothetical protein
MRVILIGGTGRQTYLVPCLGRTRSDRAQQRAATALPAAPGVGCQKRARIAAEERPVSSALRCRPGPTRD